MEITLYLVGEDADDAQQNMPFDSQESAESYAQDNPGMEVFTVTATIDFSTIEKVRGSAVEDPYPPAYHWLGWESEADFEPGREDTYFLTICHPDGEEYAVIIHRTVGGQFPLDGDVAKRKEADAQRLVDALNRQ